jgi:hypothetical protein
MRTSRRELVKFVTASGIALSLSRLAPAEESTFATRETLPGRGAWNPAASGKGRIDGVAKVTGAKLYAADFRAADMPGWPAKTSHAMLIRAPDATHVYTEMNLARLSGAIKPSVVVGAGDLARIGTRVPEFYAGDLFCPVGRTPLYLGQPLALLLFEEFDAFDKARLALHGTFVRFGEETGPVAMPNYGAYRFTRVAGPTPDAPDVYSAVQEGWVSPPSVQNSELPVWTPRASEAGTAYAKAATYGEQIRAELAAGETSLLVLDRKFDTQSFDPVFLEPESGLAWYDPKRKALELIVAYSLHMMRPSRLHICSARRAPRSSRRASTRSLPTWVAPSADAITRPFRSMSHWPGCSSRTGRCDLPTTAISNSRRESNGTDSICTRASALSVRAERFARLQPIIFLTAAGLRIFGKRRDRGRHRSHRHL